MRSVLEKGLIPIKPESYLSLLILLAPLLNFLVGVTTDLYAPSLPHIAAYFDVSFTMVKNSITLTLLGFAVGCAVFGALLDTFGRRRIILLCLLIYIVASFLGIFCRTINELLIVRFVQGLVVAPVSVGPRTLLADHFSGDRLTIALMYTSLSFSLGPIIGPFIGGILQVHFGWQANFVAYTLLASILFMIFLLYINESNTIYRSFSLKIIMKNYFNILRHPLFFTGILLASGIQLDMILYPAVGPFLVENQLHYSAIIYGNTALVVGLGYFFGTLMNRLVINRFQTTRIMDFGFVLIILAVLLQFTFALTATLNLWTLVLPFLVLLFASGFVFTNLFAYCVKLFTINTGSVTATLSCSFMLITAFGISILSKLNFHSLLQLADITGTILLTQLILYGVLRPRMQD